MAARCRRDRAGRGGRAGRSNRLLVVPDVAAARRQAALARAPALRSCHGHLLGRDGDRVPPDDVQHDHFELPQMRANLFRSSPVVMIAVDPHKASNTAAVLDPVTKMLIESARFANTADGYVQLAGFAARRQQRRWAVEGSRMSMHPRPAP